MRGEEGRKRPAWIASLVIHGVLVAAVAWWLAGHSGPASVLATPVPLKLAMFHAPAPVEPPAPAESPPVQAAPPPPAPSDAPPPVEPLAPKPAPVQPRPAKAPPSKPAVSASAPVRAQPVESAPAAEVPVAIPSPAPTPLVPPPAAQPVIPAPDPALEDGYRTRVRQAIDKHKHYPRVARRLELEGRVVVAFTVEADGRLAGVRVVESSGSELLDEAALEAVRKAAPFPPFPDGVERRQWGFTLPLLFSLDS
ncbi:MAG: TonB family protein [Halothiobacillaceae bacterium]